MAKPRFSVWGAAGLVVAVGYMLLNESEDPGSTRENVDTGVEVVDANLSGLAGVARSVIGNGGQVAGGVAGAAAGAADGAAAANGEGSYTRVAPKDNQ